MRILLFVFISIASMVSYAQNAVIPHDGLVCLYDDMFSEKPVRSIQQAGELKYILRLTENSQFRFKVVYKFKNGCEYFEREAWIDKVNCAVYSCESKPGRITIYSTPSLKSKKTHFDYIKDEPAYICDFTNDGWLYVVIPRDNVLIKGWIKHYTP